MSCPQRGQSIYMWMYRQGLSGREIGEVISELHAAGHAIRQKDVRNYYNGFYRHDVYWNKSSALDIPATSRGIQGYSDYPPHPYVGMPEIENRWVPCDARNRPMIKWGRGCMTRVDAECMAHCRYIGENMRGTHMVVIDVDGDHGWPDENLDLESIRFFGRYMDETHALMKPRLVMDLLGTEPIDLRTMSLPTSYHLTFRVDRLIPTMHFQKAHVDIVGNRGNSLRYWKDKEWNGRPMLMMTDGIWKDIMDYVERREDVNP